MKRIVSSALLTLGLLTFGSTNEIQAQSPVDIGLQYNGDQLEVVLRPGADFNGILSAVVFTIRWDGSTGATLGDVQQEGSPAQYIPVQRSGAIREHGSSNYQVFAGFGTTPIASAGGAWTSGKEYVIATIPVTGNAEFELVNDVWTHEVTNNADFYLSLGGADRTGTIYKGLVSAEGDGSVSIQPNPNNGIFTFAFDVKTPTDITVEVMNTLGQAVFTDLVREFTGTYRRDMDLTTASSGIYYLKIKRGEQTTTHKVVYR
jgi:hypothetical protein